MAESYEVSIKLIGNRKPCNIGHKVGDEWLWKDKTPENMCFAAYNSVYPFALVLKYGGNFPWQDDPDVVTASCPDSEVVNVFEIKRTPAKGKKAESYNVSLKLIGKGTENPCSQGHKVGDEWLLQYKTPANLCPSAYRSIYSSALVMMYGGQYPWQPDPEVMTVTCPDPNVANRFELRRIPKK